MSEEKRLENVLVCGFLGFLIADFSTFYFEGWKTRLQSQLALASDRAPLRGSLFSAVSYATIGLGYFGCYETVKGRFATDRDTPGRFFISAIAAELFVSPLTIPAENVVTRLLAQAHSTGHGFRYRSGIHALAQIVRHEGVSRLYAGSLITLQRNLAFSGIHFVLYETLRSQLVGKSPIEYAAIGAIAGGAAGFLTNPLDLLKTKKQLGIGNSAHLFTKLFSGAIVRSFSNAFYCGVLFVSYETLLLLLSKQNIAQGF